MGEQGARLRQLATMGGYPSDIVRAVWRLRQDYDQPLRVQQIACELGMSASGFHHHYKAVTALSPLPIPEAATATGSPASDVERKPGGGKRCFLRGLPRRRLLQSGVQEPLRCPPVRDVQGLREAALKRAGQGADR